MKVTSRKDVESNRVKEEVLTLITPVSSDFTDLNTSFESFRSVCKLIGEQLGLEEGEFKGGFDEMALCSAYIAEQDLNTEEGKQNTINMLSLVSAWSGANSLCTYEAKKVGVGQPQWWKMCWGMQ